MPGVFSGSLIESGSRHAIRRDTSLSRLFRIVFTRISEWSPVDDGPRGTGGGFSVVSCSLQADLEVESSETMYPARPLAGPGGGPCVVSLIQRFVASRRRSAGHIPPSRPPPGPDGGPAALSLVPDVLGGTLSGCGSRHATRRDTSRCRVFVG